VKGGGRKKVKEGEKKGEREKEEEEMREKGLKRKDSNSLPRQGERDRQIYMKETKRKKGGRKGGREGGREGRKEEGKRERLMVKASLLILRFLLEFTSFEERRRRKGGRRSGAQRYAWSTNRQKHPRKSRRGRKIP